MNLLLASFLLFSFQEDKLPRPENHHSVIVEITHLRSTEGNILISIYDEASTFPKDKNMLEQKILSDIPAEKMIIRFDSLSLGTYAIAVLHDENGDEKLNFNLLGFPKEGYCFSNNVRPKFRRPTWDEAKFDLKKKTHRIYIIMKY